MFEFKISLYKFILSKYFFPFYIKNSTFYTKNYDTSKESQSYNLDNHKFKHYSVFWFPKID